MHAVRADQHQIGAYAVWLQRGNAEHPEMTQSDITAVVARDATGNVVARLI